jgi:hypothetical protein
MQVIKFYTILVLLILSFITCKTKKEEEFVPLLKNGYYIFEYGDTPSIPRGDLYYLQNNDFYNASRNGKVDSICFSRKAGTITKQNGVFSISFLCPDLENNVCCFENDLLKGNNGIYFIDSLTFDGKDINYPKFTGWAHISYSSGNSRIIGFIFSRSNYQ